MSAPGVSPYWSDDDQWTQLLIVIVPVGDLPFHASELYDRVREVIEADIVLFDLVTLCIGPKVDGSATRDASVVQAFLAGAVADGHLFAPRVVFGCVLVGPDAEQLGLAQRRLSQHVLMKNIGTLFHTVAVDDTAEAAVDPVSAVVGFAEQMMADYEREPAVSTSERQFLKALKVLTPAAPPPAPSPRRRRPPEEESRPPSLFQRARASLGLAIESPPATEPMARRSTGTGAVALVYLVFVPDDNPPGRTIVKRRNAVAVELDLMLNRVQSDPATGRAMDVALEVLCAVNPITRHHGVAFAGGLDKKDLPRVPVDYFDFYETIGELGDEHQRVSSTFWKRGVDVLSAHIIFLATTGPLPDRESVERFAGLLAHTRVTWLHFGQSSEIIPEEFELPGMQVLSDQSDLADVVMHYAKDIYDTRPPGA